MLGAFVNPILLGGSAIKYLSVSVYNDALVLFNLPRAIALSMVLLAIVFVIFMAQRYLTNRTKRFQVTG
jgi:putative spermidine/putrescine transport system permease protein